MLACSLDIFKQFEMSQGLKSLTPVERGCKAFVVIHSIVWHIEMESPRDLYERRCGEPGISNQSIAVEFKETTVASLKSQYVYILDLPDRIRMIRMDIFYRRKPKSMPFASLDTFGCGQGR